MNRTSPGCLSFLLFACLAAAAGLARAQVSQSLYLYTEPDPNAPGGIEGRVVSPLKPLRAVFALPPDRPRFVYRGAVPDENRRAFRFEGLPAERYDLLFVFDDEFYEGLTLNRGETMLTAADRQGIQGIVEQTEPFYPRKRIHRLEGTTGHMTGEARGICTFLRDRSALGFIDGEEYTDHRRSFKLVVLQHVGPGWQVQRTREIYVIQVQPGTGRDFIRHVHRSALGRIRVTDGIRDLGEINLSREDLSRGP